MGDAAAAPQTGQKTASAGIELSQLEQGREGVKAACA